MKNKKRLHSLRWLILLTVGVSFGVFLAAFLLIVQTNMSKILLQSEREYLDKQVKTVEGTLKDLEVRLISMTKDLAHWDETVRFAGGTNPDYIENNWPGTSILSRYGFNFAIIKDLDGNDLYVDFYDYEEGRSMIMPVGFSDYFNQISRNVVQSFNDIYANDENDERIGLTGIMLYDWTPYSICAMPIVVVEDGNLPSGTIIFGSILSNVYFRNTTHFSSTDFHISQSRYMPADDGLNKEYISQSIPLVDLDGNRLDLRMEIRRTIVEQGREIVRLGNLTLILITLIFIVILYLIIIRFLLAPIERLIHDISTISPSERINATEYTTSLELNMFANSINDMLARINSNARLAEETSVSMNTIKSILDGVDAYLYVSDLENDDILYINEKMKEHYSLCGDLIGQSCWKVLQDDMTGRCDFCPIHVLEKEPDAVITWEEHSNVTGRHYRNTDCLIEWTRGKKAHLQHSVDITDMKNITTSISERLEQQKLMSDIVQGFISTDDTAVLIKNALRMVGEFMGMNKVTLSSADFGNSTISIDYEWCASGATPTEPDKKVQSFSKDGFLFDTFINKSAMYVTNMDMDASEADSLLRNLGVKSFVIAPVYLDNNKIWGVLCFNDNKENSVWNDSAIQLALMMAGAISGVIIREKADAEIRVAKEQAEDASRAKGDFLSRMSHEMRTPMNAIIGMTSIAKSSPEVERKEYCLSKIEDASKHLLGIINDVLDMSKIEAGKFELSYDEFDFEKMLMRVVNVINFKIEEKNQRFNIEIDKEIPRYMISDDQRLAQVIANLLSNAVKFTPDLGSISLNVKFLSEKDGLYKLRFSVTDTGIGISPEQQARLFTSFEQADNGISRKFGGTGLGLAISKKIIDMMGGRVWIESELGHGSVFNFEIAMKKGLNADKIRLGEGVNKDNLRLLVTDDDKTVREFFEVSMGGLGLHCDTAADGKQALEMLKNAEIPYNIIFVDWKMPEMDGIELTREIKQRYQDNIIVTMISAFEWSDIEAEAKAAGVDMFVMKPLFNSQLVDCINEALGVESGISELNMSDNDGKFEGKIILLAEDVEVNREIVIALLENTGITIECAEDGAQAIEKFEAGYERYDMIFMDIHMPGVGGYEATKAIRALDIDKAKTIPIVAMTANVFREDIERCLASGMNDHIGKPIDLEELSIKLNKYLA